MSVLSIYRHMFAIADLRKKILFTLAMFVVYRVGANVPVPGTDLQAIRLFADQSQQGGIYGLLNLFSGGALEQFSVFALGILPYITASIIMQLLTVVIPKLQALQEEGQSGQKVITQWTRYLTVVLALIQSTGFTWAFGRGSQLTNGIVFIPNYVWWNVGLIVLTMTAGTAFVMWLGELITQRGVGNGMSLLIFLSILSQFPSVFGQIWVQTAGNQNWVGFIVIMLVFMLMIGGIIFVDQGQRRIPIQFAKRVRGRRMMGGNSTYIPIKVNTAGVIPVIFATSVMLFPALLATAIPSDGLWVTSIRNWVDRNLGGGAGGAISWWYVLILFGLVVFFTYFYTAIQFDPAKQADMIQRQGGFIPGQRPGRQTAQYLGHILNRITLPGALFLGGISVLPILAGLIWGINISFSGVSILIVVGVALETMKQIESQLTMRNYEGFLT
jgi:preprotein translocase subunit SecY